MASNRLGHRLAPASASAPAPAPAPAPPLSLSLVHPWPHCRCCLTQFLPTDPIFARFLIDGAWLKHSAKAGQPG
ncbi:hypothetical protein CsSME_00033053 [Camellia sinensis var. sinensis]